MSFMRLHFTASAAPLAQQAFKEFTAIHPQTPIDEADVIVGFGGDGEGLKGMREALNHQKPFFGIKCGHVGFLMNPLYNKYSLLERIRRAVSVTFHPLNITATLRDRPEEVHFSAFNEGVVRRMSPQSANLQVSYKLNGQEKGVAEVNHCDGCIVATPLGSSAYWRAVGGRSIPWSNHVLGIHSICSREKLSLRVNDRAEIIIRSMDSYKQRPTIVSGDNQECKEPISSCRIAMNHQKGVQVMFDPMTLLKKRLSQYIR